jgi:voltage-gated potassium channel
MRLFELGLGDFYMMDSMWVLLLSTTTVGYGDIFPVTDAGRVVLVLNQILGVVVLSTLVAVLQSTLSLSNRFACDQLLFHD